MLTAKFEQLTPGIEPLCHCGGDARSGSSPNDRGAQQSGTVVPEYPLMTLHSTSERPALRLSPLFWGLELNSRRAAAARVT